MANKSALGQLGNGETGFIFKRGLGQVLTCLKPGTGVINFGAKMERLPGF